MFERVVLRRSVDGPAITAGEIAEALLFYQNVHLVLDWGSLAGLISSIGMQTLLGVLSKPGMSATYVQEKTGTRTEGTQYGREYDFVAFKFVGSQDVGTLKGKKKPLEYLLVRNGYKKAAARRYVERFRALVRMRSLSNDFFIKGGVLSAAKLDLANSDFVDAAARIAVKRRLKAHALPEDFRFRVTFRGPKFVVDTNLNFDEMTKINQAAFGGTNKVTPATITTDILSASVGTVFAGHYGGDFYTSTMESEIIQVRHNILLERTHHDQDQIEAFKSIVLNGCPSIAEVINRGDRSFDEFLEVLGKANRFKEWIRGKSPDEDLAAAYLSDVTSVGWLNRIPGKSIRYVIGLVVGGVDPVGGAGLSAADSFLLEKLFGGWRPSQFVQKELQPFVATDEG